MAVKSAESKIIRLAREMVKRAYAPYSKFRVGAAIETLSGKLFGGCNVENASYGLTICAERSAVTAALGAGESVFVRVVISTSARKPIPPCGACRQVLAEFATDMEVILEGGGEIRRLRLGELLPVPFRKGTLKDHV